MGKGTASKRMGEFGLAGKPSGSPAWVLAKVEVSGRGGKPETRVVMPCSGASVLPASCICPSKRGSLRASLHSSPSSCLLPVVPLAYLVHIRECKPILILAENIILCILESKFR